MSSPVASVTADAHSAGMLLFAPNASMDLAARVAGALGTTVSSSEEREFDGGEHKMRPLVDVLNKDV